MDGATDKTEEIAREFEKKEKYIRVYVTENAGVACARNFGLEKSSGDYVCFLDADDYYATPTVLERFYGECKKNDLDVIRGYYDTEVEGRGYIAHNPPVFPKINQVISGLEFLKSSAIYRFNEVVPWLGLYKREYLATTKSYFPQGVAYEEDQLFFLNTMLANGKFMLLGELFYVYVKRAYSCTASLNFNKAKDVAFIVEKELELIEEQKLSKEYKKSALKYVSASFYQLTSIYGRIKKEDRKKCVKLVPFKTRAKLMLNAYSPYIGKKIFLFNFCRIILNRHYDKVKNG